MYSSGFVFLSYKVAEKLSLSRPLFGDMLPCSGLHRGCALGSCLCVCREMRCSACRLGTASNSHVEIRSSVVSPAHKFSVHLVLPTFMECVSTKLGVVCDSYEYFSLNSG